MNKYIISLLFFVSCFQGEKTSESALLEIYDRVKNHQAVLIDVRETYELKETGILEEALPIPVSAISQNLPQWSSFITMHDKKIPLYFYCEVGSRSGSVSNWLSKQGFKAISLGGLRDLQNAGLPIIPYK